MVIPVNRPVGSGKKSVFDTLCNTCRVRLVNRGFMRDLQGMHVYGGVCTASCWRSELIGCTLETGMFFQTQRDKHLLYI